MVWKTDEAGSLTSHYLIALGAYRGFYILNWIYRYYSEGFYDLIAIIAGIIQTILCSFCIILYLKKKQFGDQKINVIKPNEIYIIDINLLLSVNSKIAK